MEGWTNIMHIYQNSFSKYVTPLYFIFLLLVCSFFILNLTIAIMLNKYEELSTEQGDQEMVHELMEMGRQADLPQQLTEFLITEDITMKKRKEGHENWKKNLKSSLYLNFVYDNEIVIPGTKYHSYKIIQFFFFLVMAPLFNSFIFLSIIINTILLSLEKYPEHDESFLDFLDI